MMLIYLVLGLIQYELSHMTREAGKQESRNFNLALLSVFKLFLTFCFFLLLYLIVRTYTTFICTPFYQNFHYCSISFDNPLTTLCCLSFTGPHYRSSYTCNQPQLATKRSYQLPLGSTMLHHHVCERDQ